MLYDVFATPDSELAARVASVRLLGTLLEQVEALHARGLTRAGRAHCERLCAWAGVKPNIFEVEEDEVPQTRSLAELYLSLDPDKVERAIWIEKQLERFIGLPPPDKPKSSESKSGTSCRRSKPKLKPKTQGKMKATSCPAGPPLPFILVDQITWNDDLPRGLYSLCPSHLERAAARPLTDPKACEPPASAPVEKA